MTKLARLATALLPALMVRVSRRFRRRLAAIRTALVPGAIEAIFRLPPARAAKASDLVYDLANPRLRDLAAGKALARIDNAWVELGGSEEFGDVHVVPPVGSSAPGGAQSSQNVPRLALCFVATSPHSLHVLTRARELMRSRIASASSSSVSGSVVCPR